MAIKKYTADADTTIVNTYEPNLQTRATGSNAGYADVMEVYSIYGRQSSGSQELSRMLVKFPVSSISSDRTAGTIPASGSVSFYLRLHNAQHSKTVPEDYTLMVSAISQSWQEGVGLDLETYKDETGGNTGANWMSASNTTAWTSVGGDFLTAGGFSFSQSFSDGLEDLELDISELVEKWIAETQGNYGVGVYLSASYEARHSSSSGVNSGSVIHNPDGATKSYYTKRFFARGSQYFFKRPVIEARWNSATHDDRGNFYYSSSLAPAADNLNTLYLYNYVRGVLQNIPGIDTGEIYVDLYSGSANDSEPSGPVLTQCISTPATGGYVSTGIYSCSVCLTAAATPIETLYDIWRGADSSPTQYFTGTITPIVHYASQTVRKPVYYVNITNNRGKYRHDENARFNVFVRQKYWNPTIYTVANADVPAMTIESASYRVYRTLDGYEAIQYGTGSSLQTLLSYDVSGNYFDFDMKNLEPGYEYAIKFAFYESPVDSWSEQPETFTFRVEENEY
mgnify:CR=1 FL=1